MEVASVTMDAEFISALPPHSSPNGDTGENVGGVDDAVSGMDLVDESTSSIELLENAYCEISADCLGATVLFVCWERRYPTLQTHAVEPSETSPTDPDKQGVHSVAPAALLYVF